MRFLYQALLSLGLAILAAIAALWIPLPSGMPIDHLMNRFLGIDDLRLVLAAGALTFALTAIVSTGLSFPSAVRRLGERVRDLRLTRLGAAIPLEEWRTVAAGTPLEESALFWSTTSSGSLGVALDEPFELSGAEADAELRRLFWHRIARLQVWTAAGVLFAVAVLSLLYRRLGLDADGSGVLMLLAPVGIPILLCATLIARLAIRGSIREFVNRLTGSVAEMREVLPLTSEMRVARLEREYRSDPSLEVPAFGRSNTREWDESESGQSEAAIEPATPRFDDSRDVEVAAILVRVLAAIEDLESQHRAAIRESTALRDLVQANALQPKATPAAAHEESERLDRLQSGLSALIGGVRAVENRVEREIAAFGGELRGVQERMAREMTEFVAESRAAQQRIEGELVATTSRNTRSDDLRAGELAGATEHWRALSSVQERAAREMAEFVAESRAAQQRIEGELAALAATVRNRGTEEPAAAGELGGAAEHWHALSSTQERMAREMAEFVAESRAAQQRIVGELGALAATVRNRGTEEPAAGELSGAERWRELSSVQERLAQELVAFIGEMRGGHNSHQQALGELSSSLNRLEARLVPVLRHVAATNRAMALLSERTGRIETQFDRFAADRERERTETASVVTPFRPATGEERPADVTAELRQLLSELEDAASSEPPDEARAAP